MAMYNYGNGLVKHLPPALPNSSEKQQWAMPSKDILIHPREHPKFKGIFFPNRKFDTKCFPKSHGMALYTQERLGLKFDSCFQQVLASCVHASQNVADVSLPDGRVTPLSVPFLLAAESGYGKGPLRDIFVEKINELEDFLLASKLGNAFDPEDKKRSFAYLESMTLESLIVNLDRVGITSISDEEALRFFKKLDEDGIALFNTAIDKGELKDSKGGPLGRNLKLRDIRFMAYLAIQDDILKRFNKRPKGRLWLEQGGYNRFLFCSAENDINIEPNEDIQPPEIVIEFRDRERTLLIRGFRPNRKRYPARLDKRATKRWKEIRKELQQQSASEDSYFYLVRGHIAKLIAIIPRLAVSLHVFEGFKGHVSVETLNAVYDIVLHYADYQLAVFAEYPPEEIDAHELDVEFTELFRSHPEAKIPENRYRYMESLRDYVSPKFQNRAKFNALVRLQHKKGTVAVRWAWVGNSRAPKRYVDFFPNLPDCLPRGLHLEGPAF